LKITFAISSKKLSDFLKGEEVFYSGIAGDGSGGIRIECEEEDIILTKQTEASPSLRRNMDRA
jgi:hypothetical protein